MTKPRFEPPVLRWIGVVVALALAAQRGFADLEKRGQGQILGPMPD